MATHKTNSYDGRYMCFECSSEVTGPGKTKITWELYAKGGNSTYYYVGPITARINGETVYTFDGRGQQATGRKAKGSFTVTHGTNGVGEYTWSIKAAIYSTSVNCKGSGTYTLASKNYPYTANKNPTNVKLAFNGTTATAIDNESTAYVNSVTFDSASTWINAGKSDVVTLTWSQPELGTNNSVNKYIIQYYNDTKKEWVNWQDTTSRSFSFNIGSLSDTIKDVYNSQQHLFFQITADNKYGDNTSSYNVGMKAIIYWAAPTDYSFNYTTKYRDYFTNSDTTVSSGFSKKDGIIALPSSSTSIGAANITLTLENITFNTNSSGGTIKLKTSTDTAQEIKIGEAFPLNSSIVVDNTITIYRDSGLGGEVATIKFEPHAANAITNPTVVPNYKQGYWTFNGNYNDIKSYIKFNNTIIAESSESEVNLINDAVSLASLIQFNGMGTLKVETILFDGVIWSAPKTMDEITVFFNNYNTWKFDNNSRAVARSLELDYDYEIALICYPNTDIAIIENILTAKNNYQIKMTLQQSIMAKSGYTILANNELKTNIPINQLQLRWICRSNSNAGMQTGSSEDVTSSKLTLQIPYTLPTKIFEDSSPQIEVFQNAQGSGQNFVNGFSIPVLSSVFDQNMGTTKFQTQANFTYNTTKTSPVILKNASLGDASLLLVKPGTPMPTNDFVFSDYNSIFNTLGVPLNQISVDIDLTLFYNDGGVYEPNKITLKCNTKPNSTWKLSLSSYASFGQSFLTLVKGNLVNYNKLLTLNLSNPELSVNLLLTPPLNVNYSLEYNDSLNERYDIENDFKYITYTTNIISLIGGTISLDEGSITTIPFDAIIPGIKSITVGSNEIKIVFANNQFGTDVSGSKSTFKYKVNLPDDSDPMGPIDINTDNKGNAFITLNVNTLEATVFNTELILTNSWPSNGDVVHEVTLTQKSTIFDIAPPLSLRKNVVGINTKNVESKTDACFVVTSTENRDEIIFHGRKKIVINLKYGSISGATLDGGTWDES